MTSSEQYLKIFTFPQLIAPFLMQKKKIIAPGYYLRKYSISLCAVKAYETVV